MADSHQDRAAWDVVASFWHERMGEGNDFVDTLIWPCARSLLPPLSGSRILDVGCGTGLYARKLAAEGARVLAVDYSPSMIGQAQAASDDHKIEYGVLDATDLASLSNLPHGTFDAVLSAMVLMDMSDVGSLFSTLPRLLRPSGCFVLATSHPSFNSAHALRQPGTDGSGELRVMSYRTPSRTLDVAIHGQPAKTACYHRTLAELLRPAFGAGLVLDALEEPSFSGDAPQRLESHSWGGRYHEFPPLLVGRFRA